MEWADVTTRDLQLPEEATGTGWYWLVLVVPGVVDVTPSWPAVSVPPGVTVGRSREIAQETDGTCPTCGVELFAPLEHRA